MANYDSLISVIQSAIYDNSEQDITGAIMQQTLVQLVNRSVKQGALFKGKATPTTNPNNPDANVFYVANQAGLYSNFNYIAVNENEIAILTNQSGNWEKIVLLTMTEGGAIVIDSELSESSSNPVRNSVITAVINNLVSRVTTLEAVIAAKGVMRKTLFQNLVPTTATEIYFLRETDADLTGYTNIGVVDDDALISVYQNDTVYKIVSDLAIKADTCNELFYNYNALTRIDFTNFNTSIVIDMSSMFSGCSGLTSLNLSSFNTANVTNMSNMFYNCRLTSLDLSSFNTANVTNMNSMFNRCSTLTSIDLSSFNTANVTKMNGLFKSCTSLATLDLSSFNTSNVTGMAQMFYNCQSLTSIDLSSFNTTNVTDISSMFDGCYALTSLDLSSFNTANVTDMSGMFYECSFLTSIISNTFDKSALTSSGNMFYGCFRLVGGNGTTYDNNHIDAIYARVDGEDSNAGYFTAPQ